MCLRVQEIKAQPDKDLYMDLLCRKSLDRHLGRVKQCTLSSLSVLIVRLLVLQRPTSNSNCGNQYPPPTEIERVDTQLLALDKHVAKRVKVCSFNLVQTLGRPPSGRIRHPLHNEHAKLIRIAVR